MAQVPLTAVDVVVIGAGVAGLSAATMLAEAGVRVLVVEEAPRLGGRASAFTDRETGERVDNGQHVLFGCYRETYAFLKRVGADGLAPLQSRLSLTMAGPDGSLHRLSCPPFTPPLHVIAGVLRWGALSWRDRLSVARIAAIVRQARRDGAAAVALRVPPDQTVSSWLRSYGQTTRLCEWLWNPLAIAALNQSPETAAARPFVRVLAELFGPRPEDSAIGLSTVPLDDLFGASSAAFLGARGGEVRARTSATVTLDGAGRVSGVATAEGPVTAPAVISSVPWFAFHRIWPEGVPAVLGETAASAAAMTSSPIVTVNLWFESCSLPAPFVGLVDGPMHWVFDKSAIFGERAGHLSVVSSGADAIVDRSNDAITNATLEQIMRALPMLRAHRLLRSVVVRERRASFSVEPGTPARPSTRTAIEGLYLAGDWTDTDLPATIEGAALSGHRAARAVLDDRRGT